jgi:hypothetical protein
MKDLIMRQRPALYIFEFDGIIRRFLRSMLINEFFEQVMLFIIIISTIQLAIDSPLSDPNSKFQQVLLRIDYTLTGIFTFEAFFKIIANGFLLCGSTSYIRSPWNILDLLVVIITVMIFILNNLANLLFLDICQSQRY